MTDWFALAKMLLDLDTARADVAARTEPEPEWDDEDTIWFDGEALREHQRDADRWHGRGDG